MSDTTPPTNAQGVFPLGLPRPEDGCACTPHSQDAGGGYVQHLLEYEPACPEHSEHVYDPRQGMWVRPVPAATHTDTAGHAGAHVLRDEDGLFEHLDQTMNASGEAPHLAGLDAEGTPFVAWLNEEGGDSVYLAVSRLHEEDGGTVEYPVTEVPGQGENTSLQYPVTVLAAQAPAPIGDVDECASCGEAGTAEGECPASRRRCGHHCNHVWTHDRCDWCGETFGSDDVAQAPAPTPGQRTVQVVVYTDEPGPDVTAVEDQDGRRWDRDGDLWAHEGGQVRRGWRSAADVFGPMVQVGTRARMLRADA